MNFLRPTTRDNGSGADTNARRQRRCLSQSRSPMALLHRQREPGDTAAGMGASCEPSGHHVGVARSS